jgi:hypothetical protein
LFIFKFLFYKKFFYSTLSNNHQIIIKNKKIKFYLSNELYYFFKIIDNFKKGRNKTDRYQFKQSEEIEELKEGNKNKKIKRNDYFKKFI